MAATTDDLRRLLEDCYDDAVAAGNTLREQLRANEREMSNLLSTGSISSVTKNSASQTMGFGPGQLTTADNARAFRQLIDLRDLISATATDQTDAALKAEMMRRLVPIRELHNDFSGMCAV